MPSVLPETKIPCPALSFQLEKLLQSCHCDDWGIIERIHEKTGLSRRIISQLRDNTANSISLDTLEKIVGFFDSEYHISPSELLGSLFGVQPSGFWTMFDSTRSEHFDVQICQGVRYDIKTSEPRWINAYDAYLSATFIRQLLACSKGRQSNLKQYLLRSWLNKEHQKQIFDEAECFYTDFRNNPESTSLVCIGSMKTQPLSECVLANVFGVKPFVPPRTEVEHLRGRHIPVYFRYRINDPDLPSCFGGRKLNLKGLNGQGGIAYEQDEGHWEFCPNTESQDAAIVIYVYRPPIESVEVVLAGFSGRATGCIALGLSDLANKLWPPQYMKPDLLVGAFIIRYEFPLSSTQHSESHPILVEPIKTDVIPLSEQVLARNLPGVKAEPGENSDFENRGKSKPR